MIRPRGLRTFQGLQLPTQEPVTWLESPVPRPCTKGFGTVFRSIHEMGSLPHILILFVSQHLSPNFGSPQGRCRSLHCRASVSPPPAPGHLCSGHPRCSPRSPGCCEAETRQTPEPGLGSKLQNKRTKGKGGMSEKDAQVCSKARLTRSESQTCARTHAYTYMQAHTQTYTRTHTHTHTKSIGQAGVKAFLELMQHLPLSWAIHAQPLCVLRKVDPHGRIFRN